MKNVVILSLICAICMLIPVRSQAQSFAHAGEYMQFMSNEQAKINKDMWDYISTVAHSKSARKADNRRKELISTTNDAVKRISKMSPWEGDGAYRDSVVSYLKLCDIVLREDFAKIIDLEEVAEQSYDAMEAYLLAQKRANDKLDDASEMVRTEQAVFATDHNITLVENKDKLSQKLERAGAVFNYYNRVYLIFFKCYKQEVYLIEALQKGDLSALEQMRNGLSTFSASALTVIDTLKSFKGDVSLTQNCKAFLNFYKEEADEKMPVQIDFYLKKDNFEKQKSALDSKPQDQRTKEDIDSFNAAVVSFNTAVGDFNKVNTELNNERNVLLERWNAGLANFLNRHVPAKK